MTSTDPRLVYNGISIRIQRAYADLPFAWCTADGASVLLMTSAGREEGAGSGITERILLIKFNSCDWNCPQSITHRCTAAEVDQVLSPLRSRVAELEAMQTQKAKTAEMIEHAATEQAISFHVRVQRAGPIDGMPPCRSGSGALRCPSSHLGCHETSEHSNRTSPIPWR